MTLLRNKKVKILLGMLSLLVLAFIGFKFSKRINLNPNLSAGLALDSLDGVVVYFNGGVGQSHGRNLTPEGYNLGIKYQCVEYVKRYYWQHYQHKMPDSYGNAKDFFQQDLADGELNAKRNLLQFKNGSKSKPEKGDLLIWGGSLWNQYGHVAIVASVGEAELELVQQNAGPFGAARKQIELRQEDGKWTLEEAAILGWLRMK